MPLDNAGNYSMNPQNAKMHDAAPAMMGDAAAPQAITLSKLPDGSYSCDDGSGQPSMHDNLDDALSYVQQAFGEGGPDMSMPAGGAEVADDSGQQGY